jgi:ADP-ribose pyrophosphatase YjhB (NUDIX family)
MDLRVNANVIVTNPNEEILFIKLKKGLFAGKLCIPGGGISPGEKGEDTIRREIEEETQIKLKNPIIPFGFCELVNEKIDSHRVVLLFHTIGEGEPKETEEGTAVWKNYKDVEDELIPFTKEAIRIWNNKVCYFKIIEKLDLKV